MIPAPRPHDPLAADWITALFLTCLLVLAIINHAAPRTWRLLLHAAFRMRLGRQTLREDVDLQDRNFLGLLLVAVAVIALFTWQAIAGSGASGSPPYLMLTGIVAGVFVAQGLLPRMLAGLLRVDAGSSEYLYTGSLLYALLGMMLLPVVILSTYHTEWRGALILTGSALLAVTVLYRWVRGAWIGLGEGVSLGYIILYLCAAEILPVLLAIHAFRQSS